MRTRPRYPGRVYDPILSRCVGSTPQARARCKAAVGFYAMGAYDKESSLSRKRRRLIKAAVRRYRRK